MLREIDLQKGFHAAKTPSRHLRLGIVAAQLHLLPISVVVIS
jgi:hypothetical protein